MWLDGGFVVGVILLLLATWNVRLAANNQGKKWHTPALLALLIIAQIIWWRW